MSDPLLARIRDLWPESVHIGWMKTSELRWPELYEFVEEREGILFIRNPKNYHPVYVVKDEAGVIWYYGGLMPG